MICAMVWPSEIIAAVPSARVMEYFPNRLLNQDYDSPIIEFADANVKAICIENWDTNGDRELSYEEAAAVTDLGEVFKGNETIKSFDELKYFIGLTIITKDAFARCYGLLSIILPESVSAIWAYAFGWCRQLTSIELPPHLSSIGFAAFYECTALTSIELPETLLRVDQGAFERCDALTSIISHCGIPPSSTTNSCSFSESTYQNATLYVPTGCKADYQAAVNWGNFVNIEEFGEPANLPYAVLSNDNTVLTFYYDDQKTARGGMDVGPFTGGIRDRGWNDYEESITKVVFDDSFSNCTTLTSTAFWFSGFKNLESIDGIRNMRTDNVTDMKFMFTDCRSLESLDLSSFNTSNVTNMQVMFQNCRHLKNLNIKSFNTSMVTYFTQMFMGCGELDELDVRNFNTEKAKDMTWMFAYCDNLTNIDLSYFNTTNVEGMGQMFYGCSGLTSLDLSSFNTQNVLYMFQMFRYCDNLRTIYVGEGWTTANIDDYSGQDMFVGCTNLVGGKGTSYNENNIDYTYAHIDGGPDNPGYFTFKSGGDEMAIPDEAIDLGLPSCTKWAPWNVGASKPEDYGGYYAWGETEEKEEYSWSTYKWCDGSYNTLTKYCTYSSYGILDNKTMLDPEDDVAHVKWGGSWTMPTEGQIKELVDNCTSEWTTINSVEGRRLTGPNGNSIFIPAAADKSVDGSYPEYVNYLGYYWSSSLSFLPDGARYIALRYDDETKLGEFLRRTCGLTVRPVIAGNKDIDPLEEDETIDFGDESGIDEQTNLDGNIVGNLYFNISNENGGYNADEDCIVINKSTSEEQMAAIEDKSFFDPDLREQFTGFIFKIPAGSGTLKITAETTGNLVLKVKIAGGAPIEMELEGKLKVSFPYNVTDESYVYIYAGENSAAGVKGLNAAYDDASSGELKVYGIELKVNQDGIRSMDNGQLKMDNVIYNLSGQRLTKPQRGVNIVDGKKVIVK